MGLPILTEGKEKAPRPAPAPQAPAQNTTPVTKTRLIDTPVRSGQRIYAPQCDLIVTSHVSAGAELIADGNIHVYGMMRGRALAGASGDRETQIFCTNLMAELVSIAGEYWLSDQIPAEFYGKAARLQLVENALTVQPLNCNPFSIQGISMARIIVVTSGKGGVGKTTSSAAIATGLAQKGKKTVVIDFDIGLRNLDLIMGCERRVVYDFVNVIQGDATLNQALIKDKLLKISIFCRHRKHAIKMPSPVKGSPKFLMI